MKKVILFFVIICNQIFAGPVTTTEFIKVDQFGYKPNDQKIAIIANPLIGYNNALSFAPGTIYQVKSWTTNTVVFTGTLTPWNGGATQTQSGDKVWWFDFSALTTPGSYYVFDPTNNVGSYRFEINTCVYNDVLKTAMRMFYYQRCGFSKALPYADTGFVDAACHLGTIQDLDCRLYNNTNISTSKNLSGGWHDAGDYNKYVNQTYSTLVDLLLAYEENPSVWTDNYNIPESGNGIPDLLDEAKYEIDWLINMQGTDSSLFCIIGGGPGASPISADTAVRRYGPPTTEASLTGANIFALAAIQFNAIGQTAYANNLKARAIKAWAWSMNHPNEIFYNAGVIREGEQQDSAYRVNMRKITGACYLYALTGTTAYKTYFDANVTSANLLLLNKAYTNEGAEQDGFLYYTKIPGATASVKSQILNAYSGSMQTNNADNLPAFINETDAYRAYIPDYDYDWTSNHFKTIQGNMFLAMNSYSINTANATNYTNAASGFVHYIHGINPNTKVYLSNMKKFGAENSVSKFYHNWFKKGSALWDEAGVSVYGPAPGYIPGGPNAQYALDACCPNGCGSPAANALCATNVTPPKGQPLQKSYKDFNDSWPINSWTVTEAGTYPNASYVRLLSKFCTSACASGTTLIFNNNVVEKQSLILYPNPAENILYIKLSKGIINTNCSIYNISGQKVYNSDFNTITNGIIELKTENLSRGIYFVELSNSSGKQVAKFAKD